MFRLSHYLKIAHGKTGRAGAVSASGRGVRAPVVIWNLTRTCNLECIHCYSSSSTRGFKRELTTSQAFEAIDGMKEAGVRSIILSGGEPMLRHDLELLARRVKGLGIMLSLSTNGTLIDEDAANLIEDIGFDYVGVSLDGIGEVHDRVRGASGAFDRAVTGLMRLKNRGVKAGTRFTLTKMNYSDLPAIFDFVERNEIEKLYFSHLVYSGRGSANHAEDLYTEDARSAMDFIFDKAEQYLENGVKTQIVTGNNDADAVYLLMRLKQKFPEGAARLQPALIRFGGNSAGMGVANIDPVGEVHPDPLMSSVNLGNVTRQTFGEIWWQNDNPTLARLRMRPRTLNGRCGECAWLKICGGNTRVRAQRLTGDLWGSDPACYLTDEEIQVKMAHAI